MSKQQHAELLAKFNRDMEIKPGHGVMETWICRADILLDGLVRRHPLAIRSADAIGKWLAHASKCKPPALCLACDAVFDDAPPLAFLVAVPYGRGTADETAAIVSGICVLCAQRSDEELQQVMAKHFHGVLMLNEGHG